MAATEQPYTEKRFVIYHGDASLGIFGREDTYQEARRTQHLGNKQGYHCWIEDTKTGKKYGYGMEI